ncbi:hypothetical protein FQN55_007973 [Onygenales sp. PD_40]|nr:hypothetical protein FQN55_007973 [Onygenales sp. PD_40]KAK2775534.1 hypothetical protein FQN53_003110 [Emmonsiellopsis sp. PD_33]KAK2787868.1 hypothetical protein FQN52_007047 [Onygenales sp. PD_12]
MSSRTSQRSYAAFFEDYDEDANVTLPETRTVANVAAKRSKPDLRQSGTSTDGASDSGYSSRTAATIASAESLPAGKRSPIAPLDTTLANRDLDRVRGRVDEREKEKTKARSKTKEPRERKPTSNGGGTMHPSMVRSSSRSAAKRSASKPRKRDMDPVNCRCPDCEPSAYDNMAMSHPDHHQMDYSSYFDPRSHGYDVPQSPQLFHYQPVVSQETHSTRRGRSDSYHQTARPVSFHAGAMPDMSMYMSMPSYEHGPPPSASAYSNHFMQPYMQPSGPPPMPHPVHLPYDPIPSYDQPPRPSFERPRAPSTTRSPDKLPKRRFSVSKRPERPVVENIPSPVTRPEISERKSAARRRESMSHDRQSYDHDPDEDYYRMPPPPPKVKPAQQVVIPRPVPRKAVTTASTPTRRSGAFDMQELTAALPLQRRKSREVTVAERRPSQSRNRVTYHDSSRSGGRVSVETARRRRSSVVYGLEQTKDLDQKQREVEEYQASRASRATPITLDQIVARRNQRADSDSGSLRTRTESSRGSDTKTKSAVGRVDDDSVTMIVGGVTIGLPGAMNTINLRSNEEGNYELNIGSSSRQPKRYLQLGRSESVGGGRKEIEDRRRLQQDACSDRESRRSSRSGYSGCGLLE